MAANKDLTAFVRDALIAGRSRAEIATALSQAGWNPRDIDSALSAFADSSFVPPVPRPHRYLASRDAFLYALMFLTLGLAAGHLISLVFAIIDIWLPDIGLSFYRVLAVEGQIRWAFAVLVLATPLYLWLMRLSDRQIEAQSGPERSVLRKWLTYLALLVSAMTLLGDAAYVIYRLLAGDATLEFLLKSLTVGVVAAAIFVFYLRDAEWGQGLRSARWFGIGVGVTVLLALVFGLWSIGGPGQARRDQGDTSRYGALTRISSVLQCRARPANVPPPEPPEVLTIESLLEYCPGHMRLPSDVLLDPVTGVPFSYRRSGAQGFELCADFNNPERAFDRFSWSYPFDPVTGCLRGQAG